MRIKIFNSLMNNYTFKYNINYMNIFLKNNIEIKKKS